MTEALNLRPAGAGDEPLLQALFAEDKAAELAAAGLGEAQLQALIEMQYRGRKMSYGERYPEAADSILMGEDGTPAGRLLVDRRLDCWRVVDIAVLAAHRGRGLGTRALKECQRQAEAAGAGLALQVQRFNPALRLYERLGFQAAGQDAVAVEMRWSPAERGRVR